MARKIIINNILNLIKDIGGNPNKFMGTKSNINFLGKGPKEALFQGQIDIEGLMRSNFPIERVVTEAETAGGYAVANKLNDFQLQRLQDNLITLKKAYFPEQIPNITDLGTGTRDLTQEGLASLRQKPYLDAAEEAAKADSATMKNLGLDPTNPGDVIKAGETGLMTRISERMQKIKDMADELGRAGKGDVRKGDFKDYWYAKLDPTAEKLSYASRFNPNNEVHVKKAEALLKDPQIKGLYTEGEVKNAFDFEGLYQVHFDRGQVDVAELLSQGGHNIPQMRAAARDALLTLMKKQKPGPELGVSLRDFVDDIDFKYITEGGGGREGDPINLFVKYFGLNAAKNLPKNVTKENIDIFTDFMMRAKDSRGRTINDPFFDRETLDFSTLKGFTDDLPPFKTGGRVGFKYGTRGLMKLVNKKFGKGTLKRATEVDRPIYAQVFDDIESFRGKIDDNIIEEIYAMDPPQQLKAIESVKEYLLNMKNLRQGQMLEGFDVTGRLPSASGGLAKILEV